MIHSTTPSLARVRELSEKVLGTFEKAPTMNEQPELTENEPSEDKRFSLSLVTRVIILIALVLVVLSIVAIQNFATFLELIANPGLYLMVVAAGAVVALWGSEDFGGFGS